VQLAWSDGIGNLLRATDFYINAILLIIMIVKALKTLNNVVDTICVFTIHYVGKDMQIGDGSGYMLVHDRAGEALLWLCKIAASNVSCGRAITNSNFAAHCAILTGRSTSDE
jgi:hypothetical protein